MSESDSRHMDDTKLLAFIDRELDAPEAIRVDEHLSGCEMCRTRLVELRSDLDDLITRHRERKMATAPPPRSWADLSTEFDRLDGVRSRMFPARAWLGVAAAALIAGVFWNFSTEHTVNAAELLDKASREAPAELGRRIAIKTRRQSFVRPARMSSETQPAMADLEALFHRANFSWEDPLSARAFARWRDRLPVKQDEVTLAGSDGQLYRIRTTTSHGVLSEAVLTVRAKDLRPLDETLRFTNELVEIRETEASETIVPHTPGTRIASQPVPSHLRVSAAEELRVLAALNNIGADLGDPVDVSRDDEHGALKITGIGIGPARQQQIRAAVRDIPGVVVSFTETQPIEKSSDRQPASQVMVTPRSAVHDELESHLGRGDLVGRFIDTLLGESESALARAHALRKLANRFPPDVERTLTPPEHRMLAELRARHLTALSSLSDSIKQRIVDVFGAVPRPSAIACGPNWQECTTAAVSASQKFDTLLNSALAGTGSQPAPDVDGLKAMVGEWHQQIAALARTITE
jgi:hypothetical protein